MSSKAGPLYLLKAVHSRLHSGAARPQGLGVLAPHLRGSAATVRPSEHACSRKTAQPVNLVSLLAMSA